MSNHKNVIEINGRLYDARTGAPVQSDGIVIAPKKRSIDGVVSVKTTKPASPAPTPKSPIALTPKPTKVRHSQSVKPRKPQRSQTLMRKAVKKPAVKTAVAEVKTSSARQHGTVRHARAQTIQKSPYVSRFGLHDSRHKIKRRQEPLTVKAPPLPHVEHPPREIEQPKATLTTRPSQPANKSDELFQAAIQKAAQTEKQARKPAKRHTRRGHKRTAYGSAVLAVIALIGFIAYMNIPNFNMRLASARAGFDANLPAYQPSGYKVTVPISYKPGQVVISFNSNTDDREFKLTQEVSNWNSSSLQENFLTAHNKKFEVEQDKGKTIYLYDNGNATWVNGGIWYQIESSSLSSDQLVSIASSL